LLYRRDALLVFCSCVGAASDLHANSDNSSKFQKHCGNPDYQSNRPMGGGLGNATVKTNGAVLGGFTVLDPAWRDET
jgi:hypothetical protein